MYAFGLSRMNTCQSVRCCGHGKGSHQALREVLSKISGLWRLSGFQESTEKFKHIKIGVKGVLITTRILYEKKWSVGTEEKWLWKNVFSKTLECILFLIVLFLKNGRNNNKMKLCMMFVSFSFHCDGNFDDILNKKNLSLRSKSSHLKECWIVYIWIDLSSLRVKELSRKRKQKRKLKGREMCVCLFLFLLF